MADRASAFRLRKINLGMKGEGGKRFRPVVKANLRLGVNLVRTRAAPEYPGEPISKEYRGVSSQRNLGGPAFDKNCPYGTSAISNNGFHSCFFNHHTR